LVFPLNPDFNIAILFVFPAAAAIFVQVLIIILLFEKILKVLGFVDWGGEVGKGVTKI